MVPSFVHHLALRFTSRSPFLSFLHASQEHNDSLGSGELPVPALDHWLLSVVTTAVGDHVWSRRDIHEARERTSLLHYIVYKRRHALICEYRLALASAGRDGAIGRCHRMAHMALPRPGAVRLTPPSTAVAEWIHGRPRAILVWAAGFRQSSSGNRATRRRGCVTICLWSATVPSSAAAAGHGYK
ncbi:hypothetical protein LY78DRAFT_13339 [Colletotrichum sublineola]|nr:hypothetical protein LY78DRAFT_13339 [Colletotrichum sublineola]